jgi:Holliday junction resolvasome RuvABC ATP-dependent DNA helicase subunit
MRANIALTSVQQAAANRLLESLDAGNIVVLRGAAGSGKTSILNSVHAARGGTLVGAHRFADLRNTGGPSAMEEPFLRTIEEAILTHDLVMVDDLHLLTHTVEARDYSRSYLLDAALTAILADAGVLGCKLVFAVEDEAPWPIRRRARLAAIGESASFCTA